MRKWLFGLGTVALLAGGGFVAWKARNGGPEPLAVEAAPVARHQIVQTVTATGRIQPKTQVNISADVSAKITRLPVEEGQWVEQGTLLVELDDERYEASVEVAAAALRASESNARLARENMVKAEKDLERIQELYAQQLESPAQLDASYAAAQAEKARYQSYLDQVEQARAALKQARDDLSKCRIYTPLAGTISKLNKEQGEIALGSQFQEDVIMEISNLEGMEALVDVDENDIVSVELLDRASIEVDALPGLELEGEVTEMASSAKLTGQGTSEQKTEFEVKVAVLEPNPQLRPGMTASAEIVVETRDAALGVPIQAVAVRTPLQLRDGARDGFKDDEVLAALEPDKDGFVEIVFVVEAGVARARQVKTGIQSDSHIEIVEGLSEGEHVVVGNYRAISKDLEHGAAVATELKPVSSQAVARR